MTAEVKIGAVTVPKTESCRFSDSEIEIRYQVWDDCLPINPPPGATIDIVLHSGFIDQTFTGVIKRTLSTVLVHESRLPQLTRATTAVALSTPIRFSAVGIAKAPEHERPTCKVCKGTTVYAFEDFEDLTISGYYCDQHSPVLG